MKTADQWESLDIEEAKQAESEQDRAKYDEADINHFSCNPVHCIVWHIEGQNTSENDAENSAVDGVAFEGYSHFSLGFVAGLVCCLIQVVG